MIRLALKAAALLCFMLSLQSLSGQTRVTPIELGKKVTALALSDSGALLYGTADGELGTYDGIIAKSYADLGPGVTVHKAAKQGFVYTSKGLVLIDSQVRTVSNTNLNVLTASPDGSLVISSTGIYKKQGLDYVLNDAKNLPNRSDIDKAAYHTYKGKHYLLLDHQLFVKEHRWQLVQDSIIDLSVNNNTFYTLQSTGVYTLDGEVVHYHSSQLGDKLLVGTDGEVLLLSGNMVTLIADGQAREVYSINTSLATDMVEDLWGNYWIAAGTYLYRLSQKTTDSNLSPQLDILSINGDTTAPLETRMDQGQASISVKYLGVQLTKPQQLQYQTILEGYDNWSEPTKEHSAIYKNIPAGKYTLQVRASIDNSNYTYSPRYTAVVEDQTGWIIWASLLAVGLTVLLVAYSLSRKYTQELNEARAERSKLLAQNKILILQQKALQLQMNPHFIFNALNSIKGLIAKGESKQARKSLTDFAQLMRSTLDQSRTDTISITDEVEYLERYLNIEQWTNQGRFDYQVVVDKSVDMEQQIPTMLLQPFVENAVKHAFRGKTESGNIWVRLRQYDRTLHCEIEDDGIGIQDTSTTGHDSVAIAVVQERLAQQNSENANNLVIESPLPSGGTKVTLRVKTKGY